MTTPTPTPASRLGAYLEHAVTGDHYSAVQLAIELLDTGVRLEDVIDDLLATAQREVGERWFRNVLNSADEHLASGVAAAVLDALAADALDEEGDGHTLVVCAEGEWHWLAAQMFGEGLRSAGLGVTILGGSVPADVVGQLLDRQETDALAVSCSLAPYFPGVWTMVRSAHQRGVPVIAGGRAFGTNPKRAERLGADAWASTTADAASIIHRWLNDPPPVDSEPPPLDPIGLMLIRDAKTLAESVGGEHPTPLTEHWSLALQTLGAALIVADDSVYVEHMVWLRDLLGARGVDPGRQERELEQLRGAIESTAPDALPLFDRGGTGARPEPMG
jgi:methanogenic corrinoid protein MtbC1